MTWSMRTWTSKDQRQYRPIISTILADLQIQSSVDRYRMHAHQDLIRIRCGCRHLLPPEYLWATKLPDDDGFHAISPVAPHLSSHVVSKRILYPCKWT